MHVFEEYTHMATKILFVGQETHGWGHMNQRPTVEVLQHMYTSFSLGKHSDCEDGKKPRYLRSHFWNFCRSCFHRLNSNNDITRKTNGFLWTNISKFDSNSATPPYELQLRNKAGFELLKREIAIIQPDVIVFLIGTKYDDWLSHLFKFDAEPVLKGVLLKVLHASKEFSLPLAFQTQHPRTLCVQKAYHAVMIKLVEIASYKSV